MHTELKLKPDLGEQDSLLREPIFSSSLEAGCVLICASLAMKGFASVLAVKTQWIRL